MDQRRMEHITMGRRNIDVHRRGDPSAPALFYTHGITSSGEEVNAMLGELEESGFQAVAPTRPGYGDSTPHVRRTLAELTEDNLRLLDALGLQEVYVVGSSAGAQQALALAHREPDRVVAGSLISPMPPMEDVRARIAMPLPIRLLLGTARSLPELADSFMVWLAGMKVRQARRDPEGEIRSFMKILPPADQEQLAKPEIFQRFVAIVRDWSKPGTGHGLLGDLYRLGRPWGFDPRDVAKDMEIVHGGLDPVVPWNAAKVLGTLPHAEVTVHPERGHAAYAYEDTSTSVIERMKRLFKR